MLLVCFCSVMPKAANCRPVPPPVGLEACRCYDDLPGPCLEMFFYLGPTLSGDPVLLAKVVRVAKGALKECTSSSELGLESVVSHSRSSQNSCSAHEGRSPFLCSSLCPSPCPSPWSRCTAGWCPCWMRRSSPPSPSSTATAAWRRRCGLC